MQFIRQNKKNNKGFTILEVLIVVAVFSVLSVVIYNMLFPSKRIANTKNAVRLQDTEAIQAAIKTALLDSDTVPEAITNVTADTYYSLALDGAPGANYTCAQLDDTDLARLDIASTVEPFLGTTLPYDPDLSSGYDTGYYLIRRGNLFDIGTCNWSYPCGDNVCEGTETCSTCAVDCGACVANGPPVEPDPDGRSPSNGQINAEIPVTLSWTAWDDPDLDTVEYQTEVYDGVGCTGTVVLSSTWSTNNSYSTGFSLDALTWYYWQTRARSQGESDETAYNTCYSFRAILAL